MATATIVWAALHRTCNFPEATTWLHPRFRDGDLCASRVTRAASDFARIGPNPFEPREIARNDDGTVDITTCSMSRSAALVAIENGKPLRDDLLYEIAVNRLAPRPDGTYQYLEAVAEGNTPPRPCEPTTPLTVQVFSDWRSTPQFSHLTDAEAGAPDDIAGGLYH